MLECWHAGMLECWNAGMLGCWHAGIEELRDALHSAPHTIQHSLHPLHLLLHASHFDL
jgi:hypothetical protein